MGPLEGYRLRLAAGELREEADQAAAVARLDQLHQSLEGYRLVETTRRWQQRLLALVRVSYPASPSPPPRGIYLHGPVGRGKSMLMDLFFDGAPVAMKRRVHFNAFMLDVHKRVYAWRQQGQAGDPIAPLASAIAKEAWLLCFDEFHVTDIADAMILGRLFTQLFALGVVVVATSNWPPDSLYKGGLNRSLFTPFIALVKERMDIVMLNGKTDHRIGLTQGRSSFFYPLGPATDRQVQDVFTEIAGPQTVSEVLEIQGRRLEVSKVGNKTAWFTFAQLCVNALSSADYLMIGQRYRTVFLTEIPVLGREQRNEARRFILLIDSLYENRVRLFASAAGPPETLYTTGEHAFEFARTVSRLHEMGSARYMRGEAVLARPVARA